jgi:hypothetical protein
LSNTCSIIYSLNLNFIPFRLSAVALAENLESEDGRVTQYFFPKWFVPHVFKTYFAVILMGLLLLILGNIGYVDQTHLLK